jgi:hypothetical protein
MTVDKVFVATVKQSGFLNTYYIVAKDLEDAIKQTKDWCAKDIRKKFVHVRPFITKLELTGDEHAEGISKSS